MNITDQQFREILSRRIDGYINIVAVYEKPKDYPDKYVGRLLLVNSKIKLTEIFIAKDTLEEIRRQIPDFYTRLNRNKYDDPVIYETYIW
ncbi:hypothetical protein [Pectinatus haikarae]|uniref:hypothetical protein n=1 Tax=Pectinatus haikarae TaxID=349096 RepID=UPI0018C6139A|nr:hypothetical protein [Pectinatus haikarae]